MPTSLFIAKLLGPLYALVGAALMFKRQMFRAIVKDFICSPTLIYLAGFMGLLAGLALILTHNVWALDWRLVITLIGWVAIMRAVVTILLPHYIVFAGSRILERPELLLVGAALNLTIGLTLSYFGYL
jgi:uncharacterized membrane protein